jgi:hypothetical protein
VTPYADIGDLTAPGRFPRALTSAETAAAPTMLEDASFWLSVWVPGLAEAVEGGDAVLTEAAMLTTVAMVRRSLLATAAQQTASPGVDQISQQFGPYSSTVKYRSDDGNLWLYTRELDTLLGLLRGDTAAAVSMRSPGF